MLRYGESTGVACVRRAPSSVSVTDPRDPTGRRVGVVCVGGCVCYGYKYKYQSSLLLQSTFLAKPIA